MIFRKRGVKMQVESKSSSGINKSRKRTVVKKTICLKDGQTKLDIFITRSQSVVRDKVCAIHSHKPDVGRVGNVVEYDIGGLPLLFIPREKVMLIRELIPYGKSQCVKSLCGHKMTLSELSALDYEVVQLNSKQANMLGRIGTEKTLITLLSLS